MIRRYMKKIIKKYFSKVTSVKIPVLEGELLINRTALITGGSSGIGYAIAESFIKNGANVVITGRNKERLNKAVENLKKNVKNNNKVFTMEWDISKINQIENKFNNVIEMISKNNLQIDILVNNAGVLKGKKIGGGTSIEDYEDVLKTNLEGPYFLSQVVFNYMKENNINGNILNIASSSSMRPAVKPYTISKWGIRGLTIGMAKRFIPYGIVVNGIAPGPTATPMLVDEDEEDIYLDSLPAKRYILPEEIGNLAVFMVSNMGRMIVGDIVYMTGGAGTVTVDDISY